MSPDNEISTALAEGRAALTEPQAKSVLARAGIAVPRGRLIADPDALDVALAGLSPPFVLKVVSASLLHKSDAGGVCLSLPDAAAVRQAMAQTADLPGRSAWLVEEMAAPGLELVVGGARHPRFGPMVMVGLGGVLVEYLGDVSLRLCPITRSDAEDMLASLKAAPLLDGVRGRPGVDREAVVDVLLRVGGPGGLLEQFATDVVELDINPLIVSGSDVCAVDARIVLAPDRGERLREPVTDVAGLLEPRAVAVAGASTGGTAQANQYIRNLRAYGYEGPIYAVHPKAAEVDGLAAYPSFAALPEPVDYAYIAVAAPRCPELLAAANGKVAFAQVMSGGFGEGDSDASLERALVDAAEQGQCRVLGPNCMGTHSPRGKLTYMSGVDPSVGHISIVAQSGGLSTDILRRGAQRGLAFRGLVTVGNSADVGPAELAGALIDDPQTHVLGLYIEDARRGRYLFEALRQRAGSKPVVALVGGTTEQGLRAAQSHTGALAGDARAWQALAAQTGMALTQTLDEFLDVLLAMQMLKTDRDAVTREVVLLGNGGGTSVLAADAFARAGLRVSQLPAQTHAALAALELPVGSSIANPIDVPANVLAREDGAIARRIVEGVFAHARAHAIVIHMNVPVILGYDHADILGNLMNATLEFSAAPGSGAHVVLVLRSDGEPEIEALKAAMRARALDAGIPVYNELTEAARALTGFAQFERARLSAGSN